MISIKKLFENQSQHLSIFAERKLGLPKSPFMERNSSLGLCQPQKKGQVKKFLSIIAILSLIFSPVTPAFAGGVSTWTGANDGNWNDAANWDISPVAGNALIFTTTNYLASVNNLPADTSYAGITFDASAGGFTLTGNRITLGGNVVNNDTDAQTINLAMILDATRSFTATSGDISAGGAITGSGGLTKDGNGALILSGINTFAGVVTVDQGTIKAGNTNALGPQNTAITKVIVNSGGAVDFNGFVNQYGYTIAGTGVGGTGALVNTGAEIGTGGSQTANIKLSADAAIGGTGNWALLTDNWNPTSLDLNGFTLTKAGTNTFTLCNTTLTAGTILIDSGTVALEINHGTVDASAADFALSDTASAALVLNNKSLTVASLQGGGTTGGNVSLGSGTLTVNQATNTTYSGVISGGSGSLKKSGSGILTLDGANTYTGGTNLNSGTLNFSNGALSNSGTIDFTGDATLQWDAGNTQDVSGRIKIEDGFTATLDTQANNVTLASSLQVGVLGTGGFTKDGTGQLTIQANNSFSGTTTVNAGTLALNVNGGATLGTSNVIIGDGVGGAGADILLLYFSNQISDTASLTINSSGEFDMNQQAEAIGSLAMTGGDVNTRNSGALTLGGDVTTYADATTATVSGTGTLNLGGAVRTFTIADGAAADDMSISAVISNGGLTKEGAGVLVLSGANTYTGTTTISDGVLALSGGAAIANTGAVVIDDVAGATLLLNDDETIGSLSGGGATGGEVDLDNNMLTVGDASDTTFAGVIHNIANGRLTKQGTGTLTLTGANTYTGATTINEGTLELSGGAAILDTGAVVLADVAGATLLLSGSETIGSLSGGGTTGGTVDLQSYTLTVGDASDTTFAGVITNGGGGSLTKQGTGTLTLSGVNTYTGVTTINAGTLQMGNSSALGTGGAVNFGAEGTLLIDSGVILTGSVTNSSGTNNTGTLTFDGDGTVTGAGGDSGAALNAVNANGDGTLVDLQYDVFTDVLNFGGDGEVQISGNAVLGSVDNTTGGDQAGTLTLLSAATVTGNVGDSNSLRRVNANGTGTIAGGDGVDFQGDFNVDALYFGGDGEVRIGGTATLTGSIVNATGGDNMGTVIFLGDATIASGIGANTQCLKVVDISGAAGTTVTVNSDLYAQDVLVGAGTLYMNGNLKISSVMTLKFTADGFVTLANGGYQIETNIVNDTGTDKQGTLTFEGDGTVTNSIGASGAALKTINGNGNDTVYLQGDVYTDAISFGNGGEIEISGTAEIGTVTNDSGSDGSGVLSFMADGTVTGNIGASGATLDIVNAKGSGNTVNLQGDIYATVLNFSNDGTVNISNGKKIYGSVTNDSGSTAGTLNFAGDSTVSGDVGASGDLLAQVNVDGNSTNVLFKGDVYADTLNFGGDGSITMGTQENINAAVTATVNHTGTLVLKGNSTVTGDVGSLVGTLKRIDANGGVGRDVLLKGDVYADTLNFGGDGSVTMGTNEKLYANVTTSAGNTGELIFKGNSTVTGDMGAAGTILRQISANGGSGRTVLLDGNIYATALNFGDDGEVQIQAEKAWNAAVTTTAGAGTGVLTFLGSTTTGGNIGAGGAELRGVNFNGGSSNLGHDIFATTTAIDTGATLTLTGDRTVTGDLTLAGAGGAGTGTLDLGANILTLSGTYTQDATAQALNLNITDATTYGKIDATATGTAALSAGTVNVTLGGATIANGTQFTIFDAAAGTVTTAGITVTVVDSTTTTFTLSSTGDDLILTAVVAGGGSYATDSTNGNTAAVGATLDVIKAGGATGDMLNVLDTLDAMGSNEERAGAMETMEPDMSSGSIEGGRALTGQGFATVSNRLGGARSGGATGSGVSSGEMTNGVGVWMQGLGSHIKQDTRKGIEGYKANTFGTTIGADKVLDNHWRVGLAGGYGWVGVKSKTPGSPSDNINSYQGTIYGSYDSLDLNKARQGGKKSYEAVRSQVENSYYVDGMFAFTQNDYASRREIWLGTAKRVAKADHGAQQYSTNFEAGYKFVFEQTKKLEVTPFVSLGYNYLYMNKY